MKTRKKEWLDWLMVFLLLYGVCPFAFMGIIEIQKYHESVLWFYVPVLVVASVIATLITYITFWSYDK